jgi:hypothetical protein
LGAFLHFLAECFFVRRAGFFGGFLLVGQFLNGTAQFGELPFHGVDPGGVLGALRDTIIRFVRTVGHYFQRYGGHTVVQAFKHLFDEPFKFGGGKSEAAHGWGGGAVGISALEKAIILWRGRRCREGGWSRLGRLGDLGLRRDAVLDHRGDGCFQFRLPAFQLGDKGLRAGDGGRQAVDSHRIALGGGLL